MSKYVGKMKVKANCINRNSNPGHIDGNDVFYHKATDADRYA